MTKSKSNQYVYPFHYNHLTPPMEMKDLLGGKGANLAEMTTVLGLPVPPGFTITTEACNSYYDGTLNKSVLTKQVKTGIKNIESLTDKEFGGTKNPLLVSVRSGAKFSMPGMMDTILNLGLNDSTVEALAKITDERFAYDSYRRFISMYGKVVLGIPDEAFASAFEQVKRICSATSDPEINAAGNRLLVEVYKTLIKQLTGKQFEQNVDKQLKAAINAVFESWNSDRAIEYRDKENIPHDLGTAVNVQAMVFGNSGDNSGTGVGFTRNSSTGENVIYGDFLVNAQGEDVVAGIRKTLHISEMGSLFPEIFEQLKTIFLTLETHYKDMCDTEFTIENGKLYMLQTRVGKRSSLAAYCMAYEMVEDAHIGLSKAEAYLRVKDIDPETAITTKVEATPIATGLPASPGVAKGKVYFTSEKAVEMADKGEDVILVRIETSPDDIKGMRVSKGILTTTGGLVSHAAVVARSWNVPAVVGAESIWPQISSAKPSSMFIQSLNLTINEGEEIMIDGTTGNVFSGGEAKTVKGKMPQFIKEILSWKNLTNQSN